MKRCSKCILTEYTPNIAFNEEGNCNYCESHQPIGGTENEKQLLEVLDKYRRNDGKYECIVPISGGRDSSAVLLKMVKDYNMKVLAVSYDNPYSPPETQANVRNATRILGVDLVVLKPKREIHQRIFKHNFNAWLKKPRLGVLPMMCAGCKLLVWEILKVAKKHKVELIVDGLNRFEDTSYKKALLGMDIGSQWESTYKQIFFGVIKEMIRNPRYLNPAYLPTLANSYLFGDFYALGSRLFFKKIKSLDLFYYVKWDEKELLSRIQSEIDWTYPAGAPSTWRWDCRVAYLKDLIYLHYLGITEKDDFYSKMIREGVISREEALKRIDRENRYPQAIVKELFAEAEIPVGRCEFLFHEAHS